MKQSDTTITDAKTAAFDLLSACALLRWFDRDLLKVLVGPGEDEVEALLASDLVEPAHEIVGSYRLREEVRASALARLRAERSSDELTWQTHIFEHFKHEMRESGTNQRQAAAEGECLYHLGKLFLLIAARQEWPMLAEHVAAVRSANPRKIGHLHLLSFYEGYVYIRTQDYYHGEAILTELLQQPELEKSLQMQILNALGQMYWFQAQYDQALTFYQQVHALACEVGDLFYQGAVLANMGMIYNEIEYYVQALDLTMQSLHIFRQLHDSSSEAQALYHIGMYAMKMGDWQTARSYFQEAIALYEMLGNQARLAYLFWGQGFIYHMLGDESRSEDAYVRAYTLAQSQVHYQPSLAMDASLYLGFLYQTQARWHDALSVYEQSIQFATRFHNQHWLSLIHYRRGNVFERQGRLGEAFTAYAQAIAGIEALRGATETEEIKIGLLGTVQQVYEAMVLLCLELDRPDEAFHYVERARSRAFLDMLAKKQAQADPALYEALSQPVATLAEVQERLREDALLLEYFTIGVLPRGESLINKLPPENTRLREHLTLPPRTIVFAVTRERLEVFRPALDPNTLRPQPGDPGPGRRLLRERLLAHLHAQLIAPAADLLRGRALLYLIPHGPLHYVPFMALRSAQGQHLLDDNGPAIALAPSATVLLRNCLGHAASQGSAMYALGYNDEGEEGLRYAEDEAGHVARLAGGEAWAGPAAKSARLIEHGRRARWLHIAGHAVYDPHDPLGSYLRLGKDDTLTARAIMGGLELDADLVTLSACMSGLSHVVPGDELLGLQRAFLYAGAPAVVCTLWEAADFVALLVMDRFYTSLRRGAPPAAALRDAQVEVRGMTGRDLLAALDRWRAEDPEFVAALGKLPEVPPDALDARIYDDPFYWAPFMLIGRPD